MRGNTKKVIPAPMKDIERKGELKSLGVTFNKLPCNWNTHFDHMISKASSRLCILRVGKYYCYSLQELTLLLDSLIMSLYSYAFDVWACSYDCKYLSQIDGF